jgi:hypothetical protein
MSWRGFFVAALLVVAGVVDAVLLLNEEIVEPDPRSVPETGRLDPLFDMKFTAANRHANLVAMGFTDGQADAVNAEAESLARRWNVGDPTRDIIRDRFAASPEPEDILVAAFCGTGATLPVRYASLRYLLTEDASGLRHAVDLEADSGIEYQDWARSARIDAVYQAAERRRDRPGDATRMALAAIVSRHEEALLQGRDPWGVGWFASWSWERAREAEPGVEERLTSLLAVMTLTLESAAGEGGICPR